MIYQASPFVNVENRDQNRCAANSTPNVTLLSSDLLHRRAGEEFNGDGVGLEVLVDTFAEACRASDGDRRSTRRRGRGSQ